jgi:hypothetical protein
MPDIEPAALPEPELPANRPARIRRRRRLDTERQGNRRERMRQAGAPETHRANSAVTEALSFVIAHHQIAGTLTNDMGKFVYAVKLAAERILVEEKGCDPAASAAAVKRSMRIRRAHMVGGVLRLPPRAVRQD